MSTRVKIQACSRENINKWFESIVPKSHAGTITRTDVYAKFRNILEIPILPFRFEIKFELHSGQSQIGLDIFV